jgi:hypothetical protein
MRQNLKMRNIEDEMCNAIRERCGSDFTAEKGWRKSNTKVEVEQTGPGKPNIVTVYLHGHNICTIQGDTVEMSSCGWTTNTTRSRLNALCDMLLLPNIYQDGGDWYLTCRGNHELLMPGNRYIEYDGCKFAMLRTPFEDGMQISDYRYPFGDSVSNEYGQFMDMFYTIHRLSKLTRKSSSNTMKPNKFTERDPNIRVSALNKLGAQLQEYSDISMLLAPLADLCEDDHACRFTLKNLLGDIFPECVAALPKKPKGGPDEALVYSARYMSYFKLFCKRIRELRSCNHEKLEWLLACALISDKDVGIG